jgi:hypothetical chaperone protein
MRKGIGLDFGTTNSSVVLAREDRGIEPVRFKASSGTTETYRSVLYFEPRSPGVGGPMAIERYLAADEKGRLIQSLKSFLAARKFTGTSVFPAAYRPERSGVLSPSGRAGDEGRVIVGDDWEFCV